MTTYVNPNFNPEKFQRKATDDTGPAMPTNGNGNGNGKNKQTLFEILGHEKTAQSVRKIFTEAGYKSVTFKGTNEPLKTLVVIKEPQQEELLPKLREKFGAVYVQIIRPANNHG